MGSSGKEMVATHQEDSPALSPEAPIDAQLDKRVRWKLDCYLIPILTLIYLFAFIDRTNAGNARILGMGSELALGGTRFSIALTSFFVPYIVLEIPANMACKLLGPNIWIPFLAISFGLVTLCTSVVKSYHGFVAVRVVLGCFEAGIMPGITYTLSCFYKRHELVSRVGLYASVASLSGAFGGLLASGFSRVPSWGLIHTWRNIFFFEGMVSMLLGAIALFLLPSSPGKARFLTEEERMVATKRLLTETSGPTNEVMDFHALKRSLGSVNTILLCLASFCSLLTMNSMALFVPSILNAMGYSGIHSQLMSVPPYAWATLVCISTSFLSDRIHRRGVLILSVLPFTIVGFAVLIGTSITGVKYFALFLCLTGAFTASPMFVAWAVDNSAGQTNRAITAAAVVGFGNIGGLVATWTYQPGDAPRYVRGHALNLGFACLGWFFVGLLVLYLRYENKSKAEGKQDYRLEDRTEAEIAALGNKHPNFRYTV